MTAGTIPFVIEPANPHSEEATQLLRAMRAEALTRYSDVIDASAPPPTNDPLVARGAFRIARLGGKAVGCGALRPLDEHVAEVRRMYVAPDVRRGGVGRGLLAEMERLAIEFGYRILRLETGNRQPEAIALYESSGFRRIAPYGCHVGDPLSVCFEKSVNRCASTTYADHQTKSSNAHLQTKITGPAS